MHSPYPDFTARLLADAGIGAGMRVLDVGCGSGDVAFLAAAFVGETGAVVGVDRDEDALRKAHDRTATPGSCVPTFVRGDIGALPETLRHFDAIVERRVLLYQPDAVHVVRALADRLRPGGTIVFQEHDHTIAPSSLEPFPLHARAQGWLEGMIKREGADPHIGFRLHGILARAGLVEEHLRAEAVLQTPSTPYGLGAIIRGCLHRIIAQGVATAEEVGIDTLQDRLDAERTAIGGIYIGGLTFWAWARKT